MHFSDFPFLRYVPFLIFGVLGSMILPSEMLGPAWIVLVVLWVFYFIIVQRYKKGSTTKFSSLAYPMLFAVGIILGLHQQISIQNLLLPKQAKSTNYLGEVQDYDLPKPNSWENQILVSHIYQSGEWMPAKTKVLIYHSLGDSLQPGDLVLIKGAPEEIPQTIGPRQFDYKAFLFRKGIPYRQFVGENIKVLSSQSGSNLMFFIQKVRHNLVQGIDEAFRETETQEIAKALLLGEKRSLDPNTRSAYGQAGVMHILAVSGLHVGIVYALFLLLANALKLKGKAKKSYFFGVILFLWFYAALTGFAPSVIRATCMFSLLVFGQIQNRKPPIFNILAFSAMLMIAIKPDVIFNVGFQLSYLAVGGIVLLQPLILKLWIPKNQVLEYLWQIVAVSVAAQLATFPLTVYYFHYFPTYFLLGNLLVLPLSFAIMQIGVPWLLLMKVPLLGTSLAWVLDQLITFQNWIILQLSLLPGGMLGRLTMAPQMMMLVWIFLLIWVGWESLSQRALIRFGTYGLLILLSWHQLDKVFLPEKELLIYPDSKGVLIDYYQGRKLKSFNQSFREEQISFVADPYRMAQSSSLIPEELLAMENEYGDLFFSEIGISLKRDSSEYHLVIPKFERVFLWENGGWKRQSPDERIVLNTQAIRILPE